MKRLTERELLLAMGVPPELVDGAFAYALDEEEGEE